MFLQDTDEAGMEGVWPKRHTMEQESSKCEGPEKVTEVISKALWDDRGEP